MNAADYQTLAARTLIDKPDFEVKAKDIRLIFNLIDMMSMVGDAFELVKKGILHQHGFDAAAFDRSLDEMVRKATTIRYRGLVEADVALSDHEVMCAWNLIGLVGEVGEIAGSFVSAVDQGRPMDKAHTQKEIGDVSWYVAAICTKLGISLDEALTGNIIKLIQRYPNGYNSADSIARIDTQLGDQGDIVPSALVADGGLLARLDAAIEG